MLFLRFVINLQYKHTSQLQVRTTTKFANLYSILTLNTLNKHLKGNFKHN